MFRLKPVRRLSSAGVANRWYSAHPQREGEGGSWLTESKSGWVRDSGGPQLPLRSRRWWVMQSRQLARRIANIRNQCDRSTVWRWKRNGRDFEARREASNLEFERLINYWAFSSLWWWKRTAKLASDRDCLRIWGFHRSLRWGLKSM